MARRRRKGFHTTPEIEAALAKAAAAQRNYSDSVSRRKHAFLDAAEAGATMRQIGQAVGLTGSVVYKHVVAAEADRDTT